MHRELKKAQVLRMEDDDILAVFPEGDVQLDMGRCIQEVENFYGAVEKRQVEFRQKLVEMYQNLESLRSEVDAETKYLGYEFYTQQMHLQEGVEHPAQWSHPFAAYGMASLHRSHQLPVTCDRHRHQLIVHYLNLAAQDGLSVASEELAQGYLFGYWDLPKDLEKASHFADLSGNSALRARILLDRNPRTVQELLDWLRLGLKSRQPFSFTLAGMSFLSGDVLPFDPPRGVHFLQTAADHGCAVAAEQLEELYRVWEAARQEDPTDSTIVVQIAAESDEEVMEYLLQHHVISSEEAKNNILTPRQVSDDPVSWRPEALRWLSAALRKQEGAEMTRESKPRSLL